MSSTSEIIAAPPVSGRDSFRVLLSPPTQPPSNPADGHPDLHEAPAIIGRAIPRVIAIFEGYGYSFVRAERKPDGRGSEWPWETLDAGAL